MVLPISKIKYEIESSCIEHSSSETSSSGCAKPLNETEQSNDKTCGKTKKQGGLGHMARWEDMFNRLLQFREKNGHCLVPNRFAEDPKLGTWVATQRRQYKVLTSGSTESTPLTPERAMRLQQIGFSWSPKEADSWDGFFKDYLDFKSKYGKNQVAKLLGEDSPLTKWESAQRHEYELLQNGRPSKLTPEQVTKLNETGFDWKKGKEAKKARAKVAEAPNTMEQIMKFSGRKSNPWRPPAQISAESMMGYSLLQTKRTLELQNRGQELDMLVRTLEKPAQMDPSANRSLQTNSLDIASGLGLTSPGLFQSNSETLKRGLNQTSVQPVETTSAAAWLFPKSSVPLGASQRRTSTMGSLPLQNAMQSSLQNNPLQQLQSPLQQNPLQTLLQKSVKNSLQNSLLNSFQNSREPQSVGLPSALTGNAAASALLDSLGGCAKDPKKETVPRELQAALGGRQPNLLLSELIREKEKARLYADLLEADTARKAKRRKTGM